MRSAVQKRESICEKILEACSKIRKFRDDLEPLQIERDKNRRRAIHVSERSLINDSSRP
jgi:hypothetical protein